MTLWNTPEHLASRLARGYTPALHSDRQVRSASGALGRLLKAAAADPQVIPANLDGSDFLIGLAMLVQQLRGVLAEAEWLTFVDQLPPLLRSVAARVGAEANPGLAIFWETVLRDQTPKLSPVARLEVQSAIEATAELHSSVPEFLGEGMPIEG